MPSYTHFIPPENRTGFLPPEERRFYESFILSARTAIFGCFTFRRNTGEESANCIFREFINLLSKRYHENIEWIQSSEVKLSDFSGCDVRRHIHAVLLTNADLYPMDVQKRWERLIGNSKCDLYNPDLDGIGYILKLRNHEQCNWHISNHLSLFHPRRHPKNKRERRTLRRQLSRGRASGGVSQLTTQ